jgi:hypothetical protein
MTSNYYFFFSEFLRSSFCCVFTIYLLIFSRSLNSLLLPYVTPEYNLQLKIKTMMHLRPFRKLEADGKCFKWTAYGEVPNFNYWSDTFLTPWLTKATQNLALRFWFLIGTHGENSLDIDPIIATQISAQIDSTARLQPAEFSDMIGCFLKHYVSTFRDHWRLQVANRSLWNLKSIGIFTIYTFNQPLKWLNSKLRYLNGDSEKFT